MHTKVKARTKNLNRLTHTEQPLWRLCPAHRKRAQSQTSQSNNTNQ